MGPLTYVVLFGWPLVVVYLFRWLSAGWAFPLSYVMGFLFLPQAVFPIPGFPPYTRMAATVLGVLAATLLFDVKRFQKFQFSWLDVPMAIWCVCPFASSVTNDLGWYDGFRAASDQTMGWGASYFLGRIYLRELEIFRKLSILIILGAVLYVPFGLYEFHTGPVVHQKIYGFSVAGYLGAMRAHGYRPTVFLASGLMVGIWMMMATLLGAWLWKTGVIRKLWGIHIKWFMGVLTAAFILSQSMSALVSAIVGLALLFISRWIRTSVLILILIVALPTYLYFPCTGILDVDGILSAATAAFGPDRSGSLATRLNAEKLLAAKAQQRMIFGWGGWGRSRVQNDRGEDLVVTDSLWVIAYGGNGMVGLVSFTVWLLLPTLAFMLYFPAYLWDNRKLAPVAVMAVILPFYMLDCILNSMPNPVIMIINGGITTLVLIRSESPAREMGIDLLIADHYLNQQKPFQSRLPAGVQFDQNSPEN